MAAYAYLMGYNRTMHDKKVLIVDDDANVLTTLGKQFTDAGANVETVTTYDAGLDALKNKKYDAAIIDLLLPQHSGLELVKAARAFPAEQPFFVILTNSTNAEHIADAMEANVTMFVQKADHDPAEVVEMIANRLKG